VSYKLSNPRPFAKTSILAHAPECSGIYGISNAREWIFIGQTDNIQQQLLELLQGVNQGLGSYHPTGFSFEVCAQGERHGRLGQLVRQYVPACNRYEALG
jgi:hypothetical protein